MTQELIIEPSRSEQRYWQDLWQYRELFWVLARRDISIRYKQTVIGVAWALISAPVGHGDLYRHFRQVGQATV